MHSQREDDWVERSHHFAVRVLRLANKFPRTPVSFTIAGQLMRSALSIPLNLEARAANAAPDTLNKTVIARKEAAETRRTLLVLRDVGLLSAADADELSQLIDEVHHLLAMLMAGTKKLQHRVDKSTSNTARRKRQMLSTL